MYIIYKAYNVRAYGWQRGDTDLKTDCEMCINFAYDEEYDCMMCVIDMDEDEYMSLISNKRSACPYFRRGDEYTVVRKQN